MRDSILRRIYTDTTLGRYRHIPSVPRARCENSQRTDILTSDIGTYDELQDSFFRGILDFTKYPTARDATFWKRRKKCGSCDSRTRTPSWRVMQVSIK